MTTRLLATLIVLVAGAMPTIAQRARKADPAQAALETWATTTTEAILATALENGDFESASLALDEVLGVLLVFAEPDRADAFVAVTGARRLALQISEAGESVSPELRRLLIEERRFGHTVAFAIDPDVDDVTDAYDVLDRIRRDAKPKDLVRLATLAASIAIVHDGEFRIHVNENIATSPDPVDLWSYYRRHERGMVYPLAAMPPELLVYVVDVASSIPELEWAYDKFAGDRQVGQRFHDVTYDTNHYRNGAPKRVTLKGFNLPNIDRYGGICADQAYFASAIGKAIGVPTAVASGQSSVEGHAWVGYLQSRGRRAWWNFDEGRWEDYEDIRGDIRHPQSRRRVSDGEVALLAELVGTSLEDLHRAAAFTDAASRLATIDRPNDLPPALAVALPEEASLTPRRTGTIDDTLDLLEAGLREAPGYARGWFELRALATEGRLTVEHKTHWAGVLERLCRNRYPDFTVDLLRPMIETVTDEKLAMRLWEDLQKSCGSRLDLQAETRVAQGDALRRAGDDERAYACYEFAALEYADDGPFAVDALRRAVDMLLAVKRPDLAADLCKRVHRRTDRPQKNITSDRSSNWYRTGMLYADCLTRAGEPARAENVRRQLRTDDD